MNGRDLLINGDSAYTTYGIVTDDTFLSALMTPPPMKSYITNATRGEGGYRVILDATKMFYDARDITLPFSMVASTSEKFLKRYSLFCTEVLAKGKIRFTIASVNYNTIYLSCTQFSEYNRGMAKFYLKVTEYNPMYRE